MKLIILSFIFSVGIFAQELQFVSPESVDLSDIPAPPLEFSTEDALDLNEVLNWQKVRTKEQCDQAAHEAHGYANHFFGHPYGPLSETDALKFVALQEKLFGEIKYFTKVLKNKFQRKRPFDRDARILPCIDKVNSNAYPSGHATIAFVAAKSLALIHPELSQDLDRRAHEIALGRVIGGVHHPLDVVVGRKLGEAIFEALRTSPRFLEEIENLKR